MTSIRLLCLASLCLAACSTDNQRAITGQLDSTQMRLVNAQAIATARDGRVFVAAVSSTGAFRLVLPVGATYTIRFANSTTSANVYDSFAVLAVRPGRHVFNWTAGSEVSLGRIGIQGTQASGLQPAHESGDDTGESSDDQEGDDDDGDCHEDDGATACDLSMGTDEVEVGCEHDLLTEVDSDHDGTSDADDDQGGEDDDEQEMDDQHSNSCAPPASGSGGAGSMTPPAPQPGLNLP